MKKIVIRTLGGGRIGYGHYYRCLSLARAINQLQENIDITFIINKELESLMSNTKFKFSICDNLCEDRKMIDKLNIDLFIFDSYSGNNHYLKNIKEKSKLMLIDDNNDIYDSLIPDIIYNGNMHVENLRYPYSEEQLRLLGPEYLIMREEYWNFHSNTEGDLNKHGILVTTGGTDSYGVSLKILEEIKYLNENIKVIIGPGYSNEYIKEFEDIKNTNIKLIYKPKNLKEYISSSRIVITAGGSTVYEVLSQRSIPIIFSIADNQDQICKKLKDMGVEYLGKYPNIAYSKLKRLLDQIQKDYIFNEKIFDIINSEGAKVVAKKIINIL